MSIFVSLIKKSESSPFLKSDFFQKLGALQLAYQVMKERQILRTLPPEILKDIGITAHDAYHEAERDPWDLPTSRLKDYK